jgi:hypothetical protein
VRAPHDLAERRIFEIAEASPVLRSWEVPKAGRPRQRLQFFYNRLNAPRADVLRLPIEPLLIRIDMLLHEGEQLLFERSDARGFIGYHPAPPGPTDQYSKADFTADNIV